MSPNHPPAPHPDPSSGAADPVPQYEVHVAGRLPERWSGWFDGLSVVTGADGTTVLRGPVVDQAALHGVLQKLRDLGIPLVSLTRLAPPDPNELAGSPEPEGDQP